MTAKQRRIIGVLAIANLVFLVALLTFVARFSRSLPPSRAPSPVPVETRKARLSPACRRRAVQLLSQAGLGGTVDLADKTLVFDLVYRVSDGECAQDAVQQVWTAFDVALAMSNDRCDSFSHVEVVIEADGAATATRFYAAVSATDLEAYHDGALSESEFIDRVAYRTDPGDEN